MIKIYDIRIKHPCCKCDLITWKHGLPDYWYCPLFDVRLYPADGIPCGLEGKEDLRSCGECRQLIDRFEKIPEIGSL